VMQPDDGEQDHPADGEDDEHVDGATEKAHERMVASSASR
jgi:hypothetical protein